MQNSARDVCSIEVPQLLTWTVVFRYTVAVTTVWSGASYIYSKDAVKILTQKESEPKQKDKM